MVRHSKTGQRGALHVLGITLLLLVIALLYGVSDYVNRLKRIEHENAVLQKRISDVEGKLRQLDSFGFAKP